VTALLGHEPPLGPSLTDGCAGVRRESCPAAGAELTSSVTVRSQRKAVGRVAHARVDGTYSPK
jgi:hypothetical protein